MKKQRDASIEALRIFCIFLTVVVHASNIYFYKFKLISHGYFLTSTIFNAIARICVPTFFMISGIFLSQEEFNKEKYLKRIIKFITILAFWSLFYYIYNCLLNGQNLFDNIPKKIVTTFFDTTYTQKNLWYMYPLIGLYIALPFIQSMTQNMNKEKENLFLILWLILSGCSVIYLPLAKGITHSSVEVLYPTPIINAAYYLGYFICGHIIYERFKDYKANKKSNLLCISTFLASLLIIVLVTYFKSVSSGKLVTTMMWYRNILLTFTTFSMFILFITNKDIINKKDNLVFKISKYTFGIYLVHNIFVNIIKKYNVISYNPIYMIPLIAISVFILSFVLSFIIKKIPVLKNLI